MMVQTIVGEVLIAGAAGAFGGLFASWRATRTHARLTEEERESWIPADDSWLDDAAENWAAANGHEGAGFLVARKVRAVRDLLRDSTSD